MISCFAEEEPGGGVRCSKRCLRFGGLHVRRDMESVAPRSVDSVDLKTPRADIALAFLHVLALLRVKGDVCRQFWWWKMMYR